MVTDEARALRPKRGRPPANPTTGETPTSADTACTVVGAAESNVSAAQTDCAKEDHDSVGIVRPLMPWPVMTMWVPTPTISPLKEQGPVYHVAVKAQK